MLLQNPMVAGREIALFMRQRNGKSSSAITSVIWKPKWASRKAATETIDYDVEREEAMNEKFGSID